MKRLLSITFILFCAISFAQTKTDSAAVNKKYNIKQQALQTQYDARVQELLKTDTILNQLRGASQQLEELRADELNMLKPDSTNAEKGKKWRKN